MPQSADSLELRTGEQVMLDGANGVGREPRAHFPSAATSGAVAVLALLVTFAALRLRFRRGLLAALLLVAAVPGLLSVLFLRGDAPARRGELAAEVAHRLDELHVLAPWPAGKVKVVVEDDDVLFPLGRYALPSRPPQPAPEVQLELRGSSLSAGCLPDGRTGHVLCGAGP